MPTYDMSTYAMYSIDVNECPETEEGIKHLAFRISLHQAALHRADRRYDQMLLNLQDKISLLNGEAVSDRIDSNPLLGPDYAELRVAENREAFDLPEPARDGIIGNYFLEKE